MAFILMLYLNVGAQDKVLVFPDKTSCVSGDTIWFSTCIISEKDNGKQVVQVQLDGLNNHHILKNLILCQNRFGEGYLVVPDSLSSGNYFIKSFIKYSEQEGLNIVARRPVFIYNRFDENIENVEKPGTESYSEFRSNNQLNVTTGKNSYNTRENVNVMIELPPELKESFSKLYITASFSDQRTERYSSEWIFSEYSGNELPTTVKQIIPDGVLITGKVTDKNNNNPVEGSTVLLSIADSVPYFDYCISDASGNFRFYLHEAFGKANLYIQALDDSVETKVSLNNDFINTKEEHVKEKTWLSADEKKTAKDIINASYFTRLFNNITSNSKSNFKIAKHFKYPFYGVATSRVYPDQFIDLPNFEEISRELLHGVLYRKNKNEVSIRLINNSLEELFKHEPLKLLNGIPVFDPEIFSGFGSNDIKYIDVVTDEKYFGDLKFNGVLAVFTADETLLPENTDGSKLFEYNCIQYPALWKLENKTTDPETNSPDFRQVYYRNTFENYTPMQSFSFITSDLTGKAAIRVVLITNEGNVYCNHKTIDIKCD
ncbi:MAG: hypothetical protein JXR31_06445 [Prolixibacteraceae bacterium]|nr:hypothetical protein [Prolixibacteraceae bacterium]